MKKKLIVALAALSAMALIGCGGVGAGDDQTVYVYNWGEYIDPATIDGLVFVEE